MHGGYSGETFLVGDDESNQVVLRIYERNPQRALVDASLLTLVRGLLPVPDVIDVRGPEGEHPALLVTSKLDGVPLDELLRRSPRHLDWEALGSEVGYVLARLSGIPFLHEGTFDGPELVVSKEALPDDLTVFAEEQRAHGRLAAWTDQDYDALQWLIDEAGDVIDEADEESERRRVLVHSDFNPKNILVDPDEGFVVGLVDWEFAHAGSPFTDYGNLSRFER